MSIMTEADLLDGLVKHDKGVLKRGAHKDGDREFCMLEFDSIMRGERFNDTPGNLPDLRNVNDAFSNDKVRTKALIPVHAALWTWKTWSDKRKIQWATNVSVKLANRIIAELPHLTETIRKQCREADTARAAVRAAEAARAARAAEAVRAAEAAWAAVRAAEAARAAAWAARAAAWAAEAAAWAAGEAAAKAADKVLGLFCKIMIEAAEETAHM